ncbi:hypothetical protein QGM71_05285 [Virgibacillus sp. C22-A2]|uniref:DUF8042 domain-containing protein n=1 Tax=Virgibacillus tibetensis TaxID=3042313 RepID=A0ABU6KCW2_9BACI|nr:hypothetical protein [Virgibacillus sp. C22-A2]
MEKYIDVMKQLTELLDTTPEGLKHTQLLLNEGKYEETFLLFGDVVQALSAIESTLNGLPEEILSTSIEQLTIIVKSAVELVVRSYEVKNYSKVQEVLQHTLIPGLIRWKVGLEKELEAYLVN